MLAALKNLLINMLKKRENKCVLVQLLILLCAFNTYVVSFKIRLPAQRICEDTAIENTIYLSSLTNCALNISSEYWTSKHSVFFVDLYLREENTKVQLFSGRSNKVLELEQYYSSTLFEHGQLKYSLLSNNGRLTFFLHTRFTFWRDWPAEHFRLDNIVVDTNCRNFLEIQLNNCLPKELYSVSN